MLLLLWSYHWLQHLTQQRRDQEAVHLILWPVLQHAVVNADGHTAFYIKYGETDLD